MGKTNYYSMVTVLVLAAVAYRANCTLLSSISQATVATTRRGLTCSNPSPLLGRQTLSGANVTATCNGATNSTTTDGSGLFRLVLNFPNATTAASVILGCTVLVSVPTANCTIAFLFQPVTSLRSTLLALVPGASSTFRPISFVRLA